MLIYIKNCAIKKIENIKNTVQINKQMHKQAQEYKNYSLNLWNIKPFIRKTSAISNTNES